MDANSVIKTVKDNGALGITVIALLWMNNRLNTVEERLYDCYKEYGLTEIIEPRTENEVFTIGRPVAVLPEKPKRKHEKDFRR